MSKATLEYVQALSMVPYYFNTKYLQISKKCNFQQAILTTNANCAGILQVSTSFLFRFLGMHPEWGNVLEGEAERDAAPGCLKVVVIPAYSTHEVERLRTYPPVLGGAIGADG